MSTKPRIIFYMKIKRDLFLLSTTVQSLTTSHNRSYKNGLLLFALPLV